MASLGQELKRERELRSISLRDISEQTKIGIRHLQALEDDRLDLLPGDFLTKAILRSYAKAMGADENRLLNKFHEEMLAREWDSRMAERPRPSLPLSEPRPGRRRAFIAVILVTAAIAVSAVLYFFLIAPRGSSEPPAAPVQSAIKPAVKEPGPEFPPLPAVVGAAKTAVPDSLRLEFEFEALTWVHLTADGVLVLEGNRDPGTRASCEAKTEIVLQTGNAGGFRLTINGRPARRLGQPGEVLTDVRIRADNLGSYLEPEK